MKTVKFYPVHMEVGGPLGIFADPSTIPDAASYPVPPPTACRSILSKVYYKYGVNVIPVAVGICSPVQYVGVSYNNRYGMIRKDTLLKSGSACQMRQSVLFRPRFQILGLLCNNDTPHEKNRAHWMQSRFFANLHKRKTKMPLYLGQREYMIDYIGPPVTPVKEEVNFVIPVMHGDYLDDNKQERLDKVFFTDVKVENGVCSFNPGISIVSDRGILKFEDQGLQDNLDYYLGANWRRACKGKAKL